MTFGENPFHYNKNQEEQNKKEGKKGLSPLGFFVLYLTLWFYLASKLLPH